MAPFEIQGRIFRTQTLAVAFLRETLSRVGATHDLRRSHPDDYTLLLSVLERHPHAAMKLKDVQRIEVLVVTRTKEGLPAYGIMLHYAGGRAADDISWRYCLASAKNEKDTRIQRMTAALRGSVVPQIAEFRSALSADPSDIVSCEHCGVPVKLCDAHVDHVVEFRELASAFLASTELGVPADVHDDPMALNRHRFFEKDRDFEKGWTEYHRRHAKLQLTCRTCNLSTLKLLRRTSTVGHSRSSCNQHNQSMDSHLLQYKGSDSHKPSDRQSTQYCP